MPKTPLHDASPGRALFLLQLYDPHTTVSGSDFLGKKKFAEKSCKSLGKNCRFPTDGWQFRQKDISVPNSYFAFKLISRKRGGLFIRKFCVKSVRRKKLKWK